MTDKATPSPASANIYERLISVPKDAVLKIDTPNPLGVDTLSIPVGAMCHEAADALRAEVERFSAQTARDDAALYRTIGERDNYHKWADKLADALESYTGDGHGYQVDDAVLREASALLRAAAGVDVAGLMAQIRRLCELYADDQADHYAKESAALESALRLVLAQRVPIKAEQVEWVVNDIAELGVKIGNQFFFLYKGKSLVYGKHPDSVVNGVAVNNDTDPPTQHHWRPVFKREFGECCHPVNYEDLRQCGHPHKIGTVSLTDSNEWQPLIAAAPQAKEQGNG